MSQHFGNPKEREKGREDVWVTTFHHLQLMGVRSPTRTSIVKFSWVGADLCLASNYEG